MTSVTFQTVLAGLAYSRQINAPSGTYFVFIGLPNGLNGSTSGLISGTPIGVSRSAITILGRKANATGVAVLDLSVINVPLPIVTSADAVTHETTTSFSYQITATSEYGPILSYGATNLPTGLSVNTTNGLISGTPTSASEDPIVIILSQISAANSAGSGFKQLQFTLQQRPVITSSLTPLVFELFTPISPYTITASKSPISFSAAPLPAGLTLNSSTGVISGTPSSVSPATLVSLTASNGVLTSLPAVLSITVQPPVTTFTYSNGAPTTSLDLNLSTSSYNTALNLTGVSISAAVTGIAANAFLGRNGLTSIVIPNNVTNIGNAAFKNCIGLTNVSIGTGITSISSSLFEGCGGLQSVSLPNTLQSINGAAFKLCSSLTDIVLPNSLQTISAYAFQLSGITSISIPASVSSIQANAFYQCLNLASFNVNASNPNYSSLDGVLFNTGQIQIHQYPPARANSSYTIPSTVINAIPFSQPFSFCSNLTNVVIPNSVQTLNNYAFFESTSLVSVTCGTAFTVPEGTFRSCSNLTTVTFSAGSTFSSIGAFAFKECYALGAITIPNSVTTIGGEAFNTSGLPAISIGSGVTSIGNLAFANCSNLASFTVDASNPNYSSLSGVLFDKLQTLLIQYPVAKPSTSYTIPSTVITIGERSVGTTNASGPLALTSVVIPNSVTTINNYAFATCLNLTSVTLGNSVSTIGLGAFQQCNLTSITFPSSVTIIGSQAFDFNQNLVSLNFLGNAPAVSNLGQFGTVYYCSNKLNFTNPFGGRPAVSGPAC